MISYRHTALLLTAFALGGCAHYVTPAHADICFTPHKFKRDIAASSVEFTLYPSIWSESGPIDQQVFWVQISGHNVGRKPYIKQRGYGPQWRAGLEAIPMLYSTAFAYVETADGKRVRAEPGIYAADARDFSKPGVLITNEDVDINSDAIQLGAKKWNALYGSVYIKFDMAPPGPDSQWLLHLGRVTIDGQSVELPDDKLCRNQGVDTWVGNMKP